MITAPYSTDDIRAILLTLAKLIPAESPVDFHIGGSSALLLCNKFSERQRQILRGTIRRKAGDLDYHVDPPLPNINSIEEKIAAELGIRYYGKMDCDFMDECGGWISTSPFMGERNKFFYEIVMPYSANESGLRVYVLKKEPQLVQKVSAAHYIIDCARQEPGLWPSVRDEILDVSRLCKLTKTENALQLLSIWKRYEHCLRETMDKADIDDIWNRVEKVRGKKHRTPANPNILKRHPNRFMTKNA